MEEAIRLVKCMWLEKRATFHGKYFHVEEAMLEPKPVQKPHPPIMIGGSGEQLTLRVVARHGNACNIFGDPATVKHKFDILRRHCETVGRDFDEIERSNTIALLVSRVETALKEKRERLATPEGARLTPLTVSQGIDLVGQYQDVGVQLFIFSSFRNDRETLELFASDVMPHFT